ncbi:hypothetical protein LAU42_07270 [Macrococcus armenti]|uniref:hypothetical protein n=1 Tax=Macrococcus armenti TaxID=2875764 RepID=UPI001CCCE81B|nr:hypothetical protein [Macrococcus armenti]UBH21596.1 hypothetical protein LAU42_07270 [Macrococcus armenti]
MNKLDERFKNMKTLEKYNELFRSAATSGGEGIVHICSRFDELNRDEIETLVTLKEINKETYINHVQHEYFGCNAIFYTISECIQDDIKLIRIIYYCELNDTWMVILIEV